MGGKRKYDNGYSICDQQLRMWTIYRPAFNHRTASKILNRNLLNIQGASFVGGLTIFGCYQDDLLWHIRRMLTPEQATNNPSRWNVIPVQPPEMFDDLIRSYVRECWHWTNLRPFMDCERTDNPVPVQPVPFAERKFWLPKETYIGEDGFVYHNEPAQNSISKES